MKVHRFAGKPIRSQPCLPLETLFADERPLCGLPFPVNAPNAVLTYSGTSASYQAFKALHLGRGSTVLCPSYNCGHEIEPLLRLGLAVDCYRVSADLQIDVEDVAKRLRHGVKALMVTHYFGFAQSLTELRQLCDRHGVYLIEDCAHAFFSDNEAHNLGRIGDAAIYSMRKFVPIPNGGAVVFNNPELQVAEPLQAPPVMTTWLKALVLVTKFIIDRFLDDRSYRDLLWLSILLPLYALSRVVKAAHPRSSVDCYNPDNDDYGFSTKILDWEISAFSQRLLGRLDCSDVVERRRFNYRFLVDSLRDTRSCRVILPVLPEFACPLYFPIWVERPDATCDELARHRIYADVFWMQEHPAIEWELFPEARDLKRHVLILPIHQDVDKRQLERLSRVLWRSG